jgi:hypothetical protein
MSFDKTIEQLQLFSKSPLFLTDVQDSKLFLVQEKYTHMVNIKISMLETN